MNFKQALATVAAVFMPLAAAKACPTCGTNPPIISGPTASASANATTTVATGDTNVDVKNGRGFILPLVGTSASTPATGNCIDEGRSFSFWLFSHNSYKTSEVCRTLRDSINITEQFGVVSGQMFALGNADIYRAVQDAAQLRVLSRDEPGFTDLSQEEQLLRAYSHGRVKVTNTTNEYKTKSDFSFGN